MNAWAFFVHLAFADTQRVDSLLVNFRPAQNKHLDAQLKDFCATAFSATRTQQAANATRVLSGEK
jgi:hypothetical protein